MVNEQISRLLIANRGEIALRVMRTAHEMGITTIAIYGDGEENARHVRYALEAYRIGEGPGLPYLRIPQIIDIARESGADAVHPGYGFLAENAGFVRAVEEAGLTFVGPTAESMERLGDKITSRQLAMDAGVPTTPGTRDAVPTLEEAKRIANEIGYPIAIKATAGGGGRGFRVAENEEAMERAFEGARGEAERYFANPDVFFEKYVVNPRHIEVQIFVDNDGRVIAFPERECSVQRRHQKLIEETPSTAVSPDLRERLQNASIQLARAANYRNVGTIEYLLSETGEFYFMEVNTRVQVEHTVTEMVTGYDIIREQLLVAQGLPSTFEAERLSPDGHAIECRINAEDASDDFRPYPNTLSTVVRPMGFGVRVDSSLQTGDTISPLYDSLVSKVITWARTRDEAIDRMIRALEDYEVNGAPTTIPFHLAVLGTDDFRAGRTYTSFIETHADELKAKLPPKWSGDAGTEADEAAPVRDMVVEVNGHRLEVRVHGEGGMVATAPRATATQRRSRKQSSGHARAAGSSGDVIAPGQGTVLRVAVAVGDTVSEGQIICVVESMKMENEITAPIAGTVSAVAAEAGKQVARGAVLASITA